MGLAALADGRKFLDVRVGLLASGERVESLASAASCAALADRLRHLEGSDRRRGHDEGDEGGQPVHVSEHVGQDSHNGAASQGTFLLDPPTA